MDSFGRSGYLLQCKDCQEKVPRIQRDTNNEQCCARYVLYFILYFIKSYKNNINYSSKQGHSSSFIVRN
jgi:hypothetical protein